MVRVRVLIVDDSVVVRRLLSDVLGAEPWIEIVGAAPNGRIALQRIPQVNPDLVTLDVEMPEMDGLETLDGIRAQWPKLPVIMFSTLTERAATTTLEALSRGATDYATKPQSAGGIVGASADIRAQLVTKIRALFPERAASAPKVDTTPSKAPPVLVAPRVTTLAAMPAVKAPPARRAVEPVTLLAIGGSTGGPNALAALFARLPPMPVPIVVTQHMPPLFTRLLAERLAAHSPHKVVEAAGGETLEAGKVYIAPGDYHLVLERKGTVVRTVLNQEPPENSCRPAVDPMFRSAVKIYGGGVLGVVLTGMGQDGLRGCEHVRDAGGQVVVQDEATSVVWGMPGFVARSGLADAVLPLDDIPAEIARRVTARSASYGRVETGALRAGESP